MDTRNHWVVVADGSAAAIYAADPRLDTLEPVAELKHPESRLPARDLVSDDRGRTQSSLGPRSAVEPQQSIHDHELVTFARELAERLRRGFDDHQYESLVIAASPAFLGHLRNELDARVAGAVVGSVAHDYTRIALHDLPPLLRKNLPVVEH
jgi:protein required for attachment to host cells